MQYDLTSELDRARFQEKVAYYLTHEKKIELTQRREKRTIDQNSYLHLIFSWFGLETGYTKDEVKQEIFKRDVCSDIFAVKKGDRVIYRSTAELDTLEMTICIDKFRNWSALEGIYLPSPDEKDNLNEISYRVKQFGSAEYT